MPPASSIFIFCGLDLRRTSSLLPNWLTNPTASPSPSPPKRNLRPPSSTMGDTEAQLLQPGHKQKGGWITFPFILGNNLLNFSSLSPFARVNNKCFQTNYNEINFSSLHFLLRIWEFNHRSDCCFLFWFCETATRTLLTLAVAGFSSNLIVYLINEFNVNRIDSAQIYNVVNGCMALFPLLLAIIADTFLGCFNVIWISTLISLMVSLFNFSSHAFFCYSFYCL